MTFLILTDRVLKTNTSTLERGSDRTYSSEETEIEVGGRGTVEGSPRMMAPYHTLELSPIDTLPITFAEGATKQDAATCVRACGLVLTTISVTVTGEFVPGRKRNTPSQEDTLTCTALTQNVASQVLRSAAAEEFFQRSGTCHKQALLLKETSIKHTPS